MNTNLIGIVTLISFIVFLFDLTNAASNNNNDLIESCEDEKCFKNLLKTKPNLLVVFSKSDANVKGDLIRLLREVSVAVKSFATIAYVNCEKSKKVCKKYKINPSTVELKHYSQGTFNKDYDRQMTKKSFVNFLRDPKSDLPWEEEENGKDVVHLEDENSLNKLLKKSKTGVLVMFYAPWCGFCKKLKPDYSLAASEVKSYGVLAAMDMDRTENYKVKERFNITGYPTILYFKNGEMLHPYGGEHNKDSLIEWMKNPSPPKEKEPEPSWADEADIHVTFLTDENFDSFIESNPAVLVMFYAPWCGHCKNLKPILNRVSKQLKEESSPNIIAFVDATKENKLGQRFKVKGYPTVKLFKDGKYAWDYDERTESKILEYMRNPAERPPEPEREPQWKDQKSYVVHAQTSNFASILKTKKHALVFFYAPWCGHCKNAKPHFTEAAEEFKDDPKTAFVAVDCTVEKEPCEQHNVKGFPTIIYFNFGKNPKQYESGRDKASFVKFMQDPSQPANQQTAAPSEDGNKDPKEDWKDIAGHQHVHFLDEKSFDQFINEKKKVLVLFYAPWCGHCKNMKKDYAQAASEITSFVPGSYLAAVDVTKTNSVKLKDRFNIQGFPTMKYFENGKFKFDYGSGRKKDDFVQFMREPKQVKTEL